MAGLAVLVTAAGATTGGDHRRHRQRIQPAAGVGVAGLAVGVQGINGRGTGDGVTDGTVSRQTAGHPVIVGQIAVMATMASQTVPAAWVAGGQADQSPVDPVMTGRAAVVDQVVQIIDRHPGGISLSALMATGAIGAHGYLVSVVGLAVQQEIGPMASGAIAAAVIAAAPAVGHGDDQGRVDRAQGFQVGVAVMAGKTAVMDLVVGGIHRCPGAAADVGGMAGVAVPVAIDQIGMVALVSGGGVADRAVAGGGVAVRADSALRRRRFLPLSIGCTSPTSVRPGTSAFSSISDQA